MLPKLQYLNDASKFNRKFALWLKYITQVLDSFLEICSRTFLMKQTTSFLRRLAVQNSPEVGPAFVSSFVANLVIIVTKLALFCPLEFADFFALLMSCCRAREHFLMYLPYYTTGSLAGKYQARHLPLELFSHLLLWFYSHNCCYRIVHITIILISWYNYTSLLDSTFYVSLGLSNSFPLKHYTMMRNIQLWN